MHRKKKVDAFVVKDILDTIPITQHVNRSRIVQEILYKVTVIVFVNQVMEWVTMELIVINAKKIPIAKIQIKIAKRSHVYLVNHTMNHKEVQRNALNALLKKYI